MDKTHKFYVQYLGWKECSGLWGREFSEPIAVQLISHRQGENLPKLTIEITKKELKLSQVTEGKKSRSSIKQKFPSIQTKDLSYATVLQQPYEDVVSCIYMGFNPQTRRAVHCHVYRCDSESTAGLLAGCLNQILTHPKHQERLRRMYPELLNKGQIQPHPLVHPETRAQADTYRHVGKSPSSPTNGYDRDPFSNQISPSSSVSEPGNSVYELDENQINPTSGEKKKEFYPKGEDPLKFAMMNKELQDILVKKQKPPILTPISDYDTINRTRGNYYDKELRQSQNPVIAGTRRRPQSDNNEEGSRGGSDGSRGNSENGEGPSSPQTHRTGSSRGSSSAMEDISPRSARNSRKYHDRKSVGGSGLLSGEDDVDGADLQPISPRWKPGRQVYAPPGGNRASVTSNHSRSSSQDATDYQPKPFSPGPLTQELTTNSPFITKGSMDGYYLSDQATAIMRRTSTRRDGGRMDPVHVRQRSIEDNKQQHTAEQNRHNLQGVAPRPKHLPRTPAYVPGDEIPIDYTIKGMPPNIARVGETEHF